MLLHINIMCDCLTINFAQKNINAYCIQQFNNVTKILTCALKLNNNGML